MLTYSFLDKGSDSLYEHLYKCIKNDIISGVLAPGTHLPSKRSFAKNLNISTITIENAYAQLITEGYIYSVPKKGFFVEDISNKSSAAVAATPENFTLLNNTEAYFADFSSNQTIPSNFPFSIWTKLMRETMADYSNELMINSPCGGILPLRRAIASHLQEFRGMTVSPEQIIIGAGTEYLYGLLIQLLGHDKCYSVENPGYQKLGQIYNSNNVNFAYVGIDSDGILISDLEKKQVDIAHTSPSHHFPTGIITPVSRRYELLGWASRNDHRYIIEDDYDCEFRLMGKPIPSLQSIDVMEKVIYMNTFTKSLASTIRISYMVLPKHLLEKFYASLSFYSCTVSNFEQYTLARFIDEGFFEKHINRMRSQYRLKRDTILECIKESSIFQLLDILEENSGLHFLLRIKTKASDEDIIRAAANEGVKISILSHYYHNLPDSAISDTHTFIINYSCIEEEKIAPAIDRLCKAISETL